MEICFKCSRTANPTHSTPAMVILGSDFAIYSVGSHDFVTLMFEFLSLCLYCMPPCMCNIHVITFLFCCVACMVVYLYMVKHLSRNKNIMPGCLIKLCFHFRIGWTSTLGLQKVLILLQYPLSNLLKWLIILKAISLLGHMVGKCYTLPCNLRRMEWLWSILI